jgi:hypothetical protein
LFLVLFVAVDLDPDSGKDVKEETAQEEIVRREVRLDEDSGEFRREFSDADEEVVRVLARKKNVGDLRRHADCEGGDVDEGLPGANVIKKNSP